MVNYEQLETGGHNSVDVSIVIVTYNRVDLLRSCLESIITSAKDLVLQIIVVDNASTDDTLMLLAKDFPQVRVIINRENLGFARANNQAFPYCIGHYVLLLNNDTIVHVDAFQLLIQALQSYPDLAAVGPQLLNGDGSIQPSCMHVPSRWGDIFAYLRVQGGGSAKFVPKDTSTISAVDAVTGACLLIRKEALDQVGLLDEGYFMYAEESDWCYRARKLGWRIGYIHAAKVTHLGGQTARREKGRFYVERRISRVRFKLRHFGYFAAWLDALLIHINIWTRWIAHPSQREYYSAIRQDFKNRIIELFRQF